MATQTGDTARQMAAAPAGTDKAKPQGLDALLAVLGKPTIIAGNGERFPRTTGWGDKKKPHPDGGTNETIAFVEFRPAAKYGINVPLSGRIYCERYTDGGKAKEVFNVALSFLKPEKGDTVSVTAIEDLKQLCYDAFEVFEKECKTNGVKIASRKTRGFVREAAE